jgi:hypothetical protein
VPAVHEDVYRWTKRKQKMTKYAVKPTAVTPAVNEVAEVR